LKTLVFRGAKPDEERSYLDGNEHRKQAKQRRKRALTKSSQNWELFVNALHCFFCY
jgi:hypothetical protein